MYSINVKQQRFDPMLHAGQSKMMDAKQLDEIIAVHAGRKGALLPILHDIQRAFGCIDANAEVAVARALNLSRAEVHGVVSFYHDFTPAHDPRPVVELCRAEACKARGVEALVPTAEAAAGERVNIKTVYCLGLCATGPNARTGDTLHSRLDEASLVKLVRSA
jgi:formate dehydrogenase subunit gamma